MARIKVFGLPDLIDGNDLEAVALRNGLADGTIRREQFVVFGNWSGKAGDIKSIITSDRAFGSSKYADDIQKAEEDRKRFINMTPAAKANILAWGPFSLFYYSVHGKEPSRVEWIDKVKECATDYYSKNPTSAFPSSKVWMKLLGLRMESDKRTLEDINNGIKGPDGEVWTAERASFRILERCEAEDLQEQSIDRDAVHIVA